MKYLLGMAAVYGIAAAGSAAYGSSMAVAFFSIGAAFWLVVAIHDRPRKTRKAPMDLSRVEILPGGHVHRLAAPLMTLNEWRRMEGIPPLKEEP